jgi:paired amphipathic helix protein Sin3a
VTSGSEDYSFKAMRKNQYEEALFRCEDDRFELDMVLETTKVTIEALGPVVEKARLMTVEERGNYRLGEGELTQIHLRSIERLYGIGTDQGSDIRRMIQDYPAVTAPIVIERLREKEVEWQRVKLEVKPIWVDVYEKNYNKSLDHRSFYFKQTDKKALSQKGMTTEIKEASDRKKLSDETIGEGGVLGSGGRGAAGAGPGVGGAKNAVHSVVGSNPSGGHGGAFENNTILDDLTFKYDDRKVHDDVYAVLKFAARETVSADAALKILKTFRDVVEPFFAIARGDPEGDYLCDAAERAAEEAKKGEPDLEEGDVEMGEDGDDEVRPWAWEPKSGGLPVLPLTRL